MNKRVYHITILLQGCQEILGAIFDFLLLKNLSINIEWSSAEAPAGAQHFPSI
jgi:hypothetical protein